MRPRDQQPTAMVVVDAQKTTGQHISTHKMHRSPTNHTSDTVMVALLPSLVASSPQPTLIVFVNGHHILHCPPPCPRMQKQEFIWQLRSAEEHRPEWGCGINVKYVYYVHTFLCSPCEALEMRGSAAVSIHANEGIKSSTTTTTTSKI